MSFIHTRAKTPAQRGEEEGGGTRKGDKRLQIKVGQRHRRSLRVKAQIGISLGNDFFRSKGADLRRNFM